MEQRKLGKRSLSVRVGQDGYQHIEGRAGRADVDVSHMVRRMLAYAAQHMPEGWVPPRGKA
ncbi:hypothetical protein [Actinoplanes sp. NBRC 101535]|uniref:hypothetical protein n=1 Tax=Actinoplanes sp. NBRC 101535 TaxID=3032196 RepID=UPI0025542840|nr:hypothetical protein [Actinoplanes sp. NBRC 101535]